MQKFINFLKILFPYILVVLGTRFLFTKVFMIAYVPTSSMENTIDAKSFVLANRMNTENIDRYDIIIFDDPENPTRYFVKRVIGLPNDVVEIKDNHVYVNGVLTREDFIKEKMQCEDMEFIVPEGSYFVMGDNRNNSKDSRYLKGNYIKADTIHAKVFRFRN